MQIGNRIKWGAIEPLGLGALDVQLPDSPKRREIRVVQVPEGVSEDGYWVGAQEAGEPRPAPPCRAREVVELARYQLDADGTSTIFYIHPEVENA